MFSQAESAHARSRLVSAAITLVVAMGITAAGHAQSWPPYEGRQPTKASL